MTVHFLKTWPKFFDQVLLGDKPFEIRRNDRDYRLGDILVLQEYSPPRHSLTGAVTEEGRYLGREYRVVVTYITDFPPGLREGYVCMGIRPE